MKIPSQVWLYKLFNSKYFDTWMAVSYLHRYPCIGIHKYICDKLKQRDDLEIVLPQLIHIMFYHTNHVISFPIYNLFLEKSDSYKFAVSLFFHLKSFIKLLSTEKLFFCKNLIAQILDLHKVKENFVEQSIKEEDIEMLITDEFDQKIPLVEKKSNRRKEGYLGLEGLLVYFVKSITWNVSENLTEKLDNYENIFRIKKENTFKEFKFSDMENSFNFKTNLIFLNELVKITFRLKDLPKNIQQKGLEIELTKLQMELPLEIIVPFLPDKFILNISLEDSYVLDSAKNSPYVMVIELAEEIKEIQREIDPKTHTAIFLLEQINNLKNLPENKNLKENIIEKLDSLTENKPIKNEDWKLRKKKIKENSEFKDLKGYEIFSFIVKSGNDFKQELIAYQLLTEIKRIFELEGKEIWIKNYEIYLIENDSGLVETVTNMTSIHNLKKKNLGKKNFSLLDFYAKNFKNNLLQAKKNFLNSLVGYSLITYFLQLKDRHNGNISIDEEGHIIHVDFGFILGDHPGFYNVEKAPFKFSQEYFELLDNSLEEFKKLFVDGFLTLRKYSDRLCRIVEILIQNSHLKCVNRNSVLDFKNRFKLDICNKEIEKYIVSLVDLACTSRSTGIYDHFQYFSNGYL